VAERKRIRMRVLPNGAVVITDPDPAALELIRALDPSFTVRTAPLPGFVRPRLLTTRAAGGGMRSSVLSEATDQELWAAHDSAMRRLASREPGETSLLDLKIELATRMLRHCELCALCCGVNRLQGERGRCGLGTDAFVYEAYVHIAEEPPINPALNVSLRGCGMRCVSCQQAPALDPRGTATEALVPAFWERLDLGKARSLVFIGGNPTESLPAVLSFLRAAPAEFALPIGWNCSGYDAVDAIRLLDGICDVYVPDFKFGNDTCATRWSEAPGYVENARGVMREMLKQQVPVFVRLLVLPGHRQCCHEPALAALAGLFASGHLSVSIHGTYLPEWKALSPNGPLAWRPSAEEVSAVRRRVHELRLTVIE
jgi:putative pyruvate formate lyase activating enzyme